MKNECTQKENNAQDETAPLLLLGNENVEMVSSDQEVAKQSLGDALITSEENVVIEIDTDVDANVSTYRKFKSFS